MKIWIETYVGNVRISAELGRERGRERSGGEIRRGDAKLSGVLRSPLKQQAEDKRVNHFHYLLRWFKILKSEKTQTLGPSFSPREWHTGRSLLTAKGSQEKTYRPALWTLDLEEAGGGRTRSGKILGTELEWGNSVFKFSSSPRRPTSIRRSRPASSTAPPFRGCDALAKHQVYVASAAFLARPPSLSLCNHLSQAWKPHTSL